jgi:hypothetical protein
MIVTSWFLEKFKTYQVNAFHLRSNRKILNNLIGYISWQAYIYFWALGWFAFWKDLNFILKSFPESIPVSLV